MKCLIPVLISALFRTATAEDFEMLILHNNDMHARFEETKESIGGRVVGGFARTATIINEARRDAEAGKGPPVLYLNAGDTFTGTVWFSVHRWNITVPFINALSPDAMSLGNHEFDDGIEFLNSFVKSINSPILSANLDFRNESDLAEYVKPSTILNVRGRKIGIIGYLTPETKLMATTGNVQFEDEVTAIRRECKSLRKEGVNIIIALGHSGYEMDKKIAAEVQDVDIVVGGHTNTFLYNGEPPDDEKPEDVYPTQVKQRSGKIVPVVQAYAYTKYLGNLTVVFDDEGTLKTFAGQPIFMNEKIPQDPKILSLLDEFRGAVDKFNFDVVGKTRTYLNGETCRYQECNFGNALTDSFVDYVTNLYKTVYWSTTSIAIVNGGSVRSSINASSVANNITVGDLIGAIPFKQSLVTFSLTGKDLVKTLETGARSNGETSRGEFLQVSGLKVTYDYQQPPMKRVVSVKVRCQDCHVPSYSPVKEDSIYRIVSTKFLMNGGDGFTVLKENAINATAEEIFDAQSLQEFFRFYKLLTPQEEERITILKSESVTYSSATKIHTLYQNSRYFYITFLSLVITLPFLM